MADVTSKQKMFNPIIAHNVLPIKKLRTGLIELDNSLGGGLPIHGIVEVCGESGSGKTQFALQLALRAQFPEEKGGLGGGVMYISTGKQLPSVRLQLLAAAVPERFAHINFLDNIHVSHVQTINILKECLKKLPELITQLKVKLVIIDCVSGLFYDSPDWDARQNTQDLRDIGSILHGLQYQFGVGILCINGVTENIKENIRVPALGLAWSNLVTTRLQFLKGSGEQRNFYMCFSPMVPNVKGVFHIKGTHLI